MNSNLTDTVIVTALVEFIPEHTYAEHSVFFYKYTIRVQNFETRAITILARYWKITDATGVTRIVEGKGVVGEEPTLLPGQEYVYSSFSSFNWEWGKMEGYYTVQYDSGECARVLIPPFLLHAAALLN
mgnify:FL=1